jgi:hypothetical protein
MSVNLEPLIQLHYLDQQIAAFNQRISKIPSQIQELDKKLDRFRQNIQEKQKLIQENQKKRRELESDLALIETKRNRYKEQLDTVKTNKEYTGLQHEIEGVNQAIRQIEDQILAQMEDAENLKQQLQEANRAKDKEETALLEEKKVIQAEADKLNEEMERLKEQRNGWAVQIPPVILETYEQTAMHRRGIAMAEAKDAVCQECQMRIRPQLFQEIKRNDTIITCESCSRILFYVSPPSPEKPELQPGL